MKKITFIFSILILSLTVGAQKTDFKTAVKEITVKAQTQTVMDFAVTAKSFIAEFYPNGFNEADFVKKVSELSEGFKPDCAGCVGTYIGCYERAGRPPCNGSMQCVALCSTQFQQCYAACGGGNPPLAKTK